MTSRVFSFVLFLTCLTPFAADPARQGYPFALPPENAFSVLARLEKVSGTPLAVSPDEKSLFAESAGGKLDKWSFADACLLASGVTDPAKRREYAKKIDELEVEV